MTSTIEYTGQLRTLATHLKSGEKITTDAPTDNQGKGEYFSPTDLLATSLACCMLTTMGILAERKNIDMKGSRIDCLKVMASDPRRVAEVHVKLILPGANIPVDERVAFQNTALTCPVAKSLHPDINQVVEFIYQ